ncbi:hypothetical protein [Bacillus alkalicellulosilyticus]|uniref:hypothetical protein n=1 Tax=Alkalihalobacterium alkalicellulosilyticum TaxID=1912214 RepID=UPI000996DCA7|nr:hypothetical protein [Bacillus alkalicellulosilyticus]
MKFLSGKKILFFSLTILAVVFIVKYDQIAKQEERIYEILAENGFKQILHQEETKNGVVVFYIPDIKTDNDHETVSDLSAIYIERTWFGWKGTIDRGGYSTSVDRAITSQYLGRSGKSKNSPFPLLFGEIHQPEISTIQVVNKGNERIDEAKVITTDNNTIWFLFIDENIREISIQGLDVNGNLIKEAGVN